MKHFPFETTVRRIMHADWGKSHDNADDAERELVADPEKLTAFALMTLLKRLTITHTVYKNGLQIGPPPESAKLFSDVSVGDLLYEFDCDEGLERYVVIQTDGAGHAFVIQTEGQIHFGKWATDHLHSTVQGAMRHDAEYELGYGTRKVNNANKILDAINHGGDLSLFESGFGYYEP